MAINIREDKNLYKKVNAMLVSAVNYVYKINKANPKY